MNRWIKSAVAGIALFYMAAYSAQDRADGLGPRVSNTSLRMPASIESDDGAALLPATLAETGVFADLASLTPNPGIIPYDLNVTFWSDGAHKRRWFSLPDTNQHIGFNAEIPWSFPAGTVWIKHFELDSFDGQTQAARRIETRLLVRTAGGVYGVVYRWNETQTKATLLPEEGLDEDLDITDETGETHTQVWHYPSRSECLRCHTQVAGYTLGFNTWQLNREIAYGGVPCNQIAALDQAGYFANHVADIQSLRALASATNTAWSLEHRVRSFLAANCVQCHQPGGETINSWDARITTPTADARIINGRLAFPPRDTPQSRVIVPGSLDLSYMYFRLSHLDGSHMPPLATTVLNTAGIDLVGEWITNDLSQYESFADWQKRIFGSADVPTAAPLADPDGDGAMNEQEYLLGGDPLAPGDAWKIKIEPAAGSVKIEFLRLANRGFEVQCTANLGEPNSWVALDVPENRSYFFPSTTAKVVIEDPLLWTVRGFTGCAFRHLEFEKISPGVPPFRAKCHPLANQPFFKGREEAVTSRYQTMH